MAQMPDRPALVGWHDLNARRFGECGMICSTFNASMPPTEAVSYLSDIAIGGFPLAIWFEVFSDGRGFTLARHLREVAHHAGLLLAYGHLIPDQADYLQRCGFSHVQIGADVASQWCLSQTLAPPPMQHVLSTGRARMQPRSTLERQDRQGGTPCPTRPA